MEDQICSKDGCHRSLCSRGCWGVHYTHRRWGRPSHHRWSHRQPGRRSRVVVDRTSTGQRVGDRVASRLSILTTSVTQQRVAPDL